MSTHLDLRGTVVCLGVRYILHSQRPVFVQRDWSQRSNKKIPTINTFFSVTAYASTTFIEPSAKDTANICLRRPVCAQSAFAERHHISLCASVRASSETFLAFLAFLAGHLTAPPCRSCRRRSCRPARGWWLSPRWAAPVAVCGQRSAPTARRSARRRQPRR